MPASNQGERDRLQGEPLFREHGRQVAALCWRTGTDGPEVLLITSLNSKRWIVPKGWAEADLSPAENAAREAFEEAGVTGKLDSRPIGSFHYLKEKKDGGGMPCKVDVFALQVTRQVEDWPEKGAREMLWLSPEQAAIKVSEPGLRSLFQGLRKQLPAHRARGARTG
jgi:8-oxo-dGTP pyrophosphatase MutT (NUDIX family)